MESRMEYKNVERIEMANTNHGSLCSAHVAARDSFRRFLHPAAEPRMLLRAKHSAQPTSSKPSSCMNRCNHSANGKLESTQPSATLHGGKSPRQRKHGSLRFLMHGPGKLISIARHQIEEGNGPYHRTSEPQELSGVVRILSLLLCPNRGDADMPRHGRCERHQEKEAKTFQDTECQMLLIIIVPLFDSAERHQMTRNDHA